MYIKTAGVYAAPGDRCVEVNRYYECRLGPGGDCVKLRYNIAH